MTKFYKNEKKFDTQLAVGYIMYMMVGSYFSSSKNVRDFKKLYLHYAEVPREKQYQYEEQVIQAVEELPPQFLQKISDLRCEANFTFRKGEIIVEFRTGGFEGLRCFVKQDGTFRILPMQNA